jgi:hypothetical protein
MVDSQRRSGSGGLSRWGRFRQQRNDCGERFTAVLLMREHDHVYRDWKNAEGHCQVRIYAGTKQSDQLPIVIVSEAADNDGPSITNTIEQIAAEVLLRYLPGQDGLEPPVVLVEHYPDRQPARPPGTTRSSARHSIWSASTAGRRDQFIQPDDASSTRWAFPLGAMSTERRWKS